MLEVEKISSLSYKEHVELRSTLHALTNRDFICSQCIGKFNSRADGKAMLEKVKRTKGCETPHSMAVHKIVQGGTRLNYNSCIGNFFSYSAMHWVGFYSSFEQGVMPFSGGYMDQPAKFIDVMNIVASHKQDEILRNAQAQKQAAKRRGPRVG